MRFVVGGGKTAFGKGLVTGGIGQPHASIGAGQHGLDAHVTASGTVNPSDHTGDDDVLDGMTYRFRLEGGVQREHDARHRIASGQGAQQREQISAQRAGDASVGKLEHLDALSAAVTHRPADDALPQFGQIVADDDGAGGSAQRTGHLVDPLGGAPGGPGDHHDRCSAIGNHSNPFR